MLLRLVSDQFLDLHDLNFTQESPSFDIIKKLMGRKQTIQICALQDSRDEKSNKLSLKLKRLQRIEDYIHEERGTRDLYVGWPFIRGKFSDGTPVRCPLLFFPVELDTQKESWVLKQREEVNTTLNKSFLLAYAFFNKVKLSEELLERVFDDFDTDSTVFRTALYQLFKESPVEINFNSEIFTDKLETYESFRRDDFESLTKSGELKLFPEAVLGIFPQAGSHLVPDYMDLIENNKIPDIESFFAARTRIEDEKDSKIGPTNFLNRVKEEQIITPYRLDVFQENAIKAAKKGNSMVVQGPPGTGKSQLICNLIADGIAEGKRVLLVSQKRAALDVVYQRLEAKDIAQFVALVHDFKNDRKQIYDKLGHQVDRIPEFIQRNNGLDIIQLERQFLQSSRNVDRISEELEEFKQALFDEEECGVSIKELYLTSGRDDPAVNVKQEYRHFQLDKIDDFLRKLEEYFLYSAKFTQTSYLLRNRKPFVGYSLQDLRNMQDILEDLPKFQNQLSNDVSKIIGEGLDVEDAQKLYERREEIRELLKILQEGKVYNFFQNMTRFQDKDTDIQELATAERVLIDCFRGEGIEDSLPSSELGKIQETLERARIARKNPISFLRWRLFSKDIYYLKRVLVANGLRSDRKGYKSLVKKVDNRLNLEHNISNLKERDWLLDVPMEYEKLAFQNWFHLQKAALKAKSEFFSIRNFKEYFPVSTLSLAEFMSRLDQLFELLDSIPQHRSRWIQYFASSQISNILKNPELSYQLSELLNKDFDALCEFDGLKASLDSIESAVLEKVQDYKENIQYGEARDTFLNSIRLAWIDHIETKYPVLRSTASLKFHKMVSEMQQSVESKHGVSTDILLLKARERTYHDVEYNRLNNMVTYRDLHHQVTKKRRVWPLRKLISHYYDEVFDLLPCWMASPEAVSAIFPMEQIFDLVIFDEASQCYSEKGIPAMYRGKQIVIAGDSKQLRPNDLYQIRWEDDPDELEGDNPDSDIALEVDSLLDLSAPYLMNVQLQGHYRSKSLDLIDFSNRHFYENKLSMLPDKNIADMNEPAIHYIKVNGVWENNSNYVEAEKVAELVSDIHVKNPEQSIGVVTFNAKQQNLIMDVIEQNFTGEAKVIPKTIFVKNIENVQGDERDIIIFSTAYAKDPGGRLVMQFGSLNAEGGENRLNVAVTRAKEQIYIVTSISPNQLKVEDAKNEGPRLLKSYLEYALEVSNGKYRPQQTTDTSHNAGWYLKSKLKEGVSGLEKGIVFNNEMPFADLSIIKAEKYIGLLMTDDDLYYQSPSIKEAHVYLPHTFNMKNWKHIEVFSREFWIDRDQVHEKILRFINQNI
jgi:hypothetical protein